MTPTEPEQQNEQATMAASESEQAMLLLVAAMLRKTGRKRVRITHDDLREATAALAAGRVVSSVSADNTAIVYELQTKKKGSHQ